MKLFSHHMIYKMPLENPRSKSKDRKKKKSSDDKKSDKKVIKKSSVKSTSADGKVSQTAKQSVSINIGTEPPKSKRRGRPRKKQAPVQAPPPQQLVRQVPPVQEIFRPQPPLQQQSFPNNTPPAPPIRPAVLGSVKAPSLNDKTGVGVGMKDELINPLLSREEIRRRRLLVMSGRNPQSMFDDDDVSVLSDEAVGSRSSNRSMMGSSLGSEELDASEMIERITGDMSLSSAQRLKKIQELLQKMKEEEGSITSRGSDFSQYERADADTGMLRSFPHSTLNDKPSDLGFNKRNVDVMKTFKTAPVEGDFYNPEGKDYSVLKPRPTSEFIEPISVRALKPRGRRVVGEEDPAPSEAELAFREPVVFNVESREYRMGRPFGSKDAEKRTRRSKAPSRERPIEAEEPPPAQPLGAEEPPPPQLGAEEPPAPTERLMIKRNKEYRAKVSRQALNWRDINDEIRTRSEKLKRQLTDAEREEVFNRFGETREGIDPLAIALANQKDEFDTARDAPPSREPMRPNVLIYATDQDLRDTGIKLSDEPTDVPQFESGVVPMGQASLPEDDPIQDITFA
jgi:hypothetical protein